jgi:hypothetical protein
MCTATFWDPPGPTDAVTVKRAKIGEGQWVTSLLLDVPSQVGLRTVN